MVMSNIIAASGRRIRRTGDNPATNKEMSPEWSYSSARTPGGTAVNDQSALTLISVFRALQMLSSTMGGLPPQVFQESINADGSEGPTRKLKTQDTAYLWQRPNPEMTAISFWERVFGDELRGNGFIWVEKDDGPDPVALWYIDRNRVRVGRTSSGVKIYELDNELPMIDYKAGGEIVHIPNWGGALTGYDPTKFAAKAIASGLAAEEYAARAYSEGSVPPGVLSTQQELTEAQSDALADSWERKHAAARNLKIAVLSNGATFQKISPGMEEMQVLESRLFTVNQMAVLFGVPPYMLGDLSHASQGGGNGLEEQNRQVTTYNLNAHLLRVQQAVSDDLLTRELTDRYFRFNVAAMLRGNTLQVNQGLRVADYMTINEKRALNELEPVDGGDVVLAMTNMVPLDKLEEVAMGANSGGA